jgi:glycosyltransferase involved in cell wall biosynthesis
MNGCPTICGIIPAYNARDTISEVVRGALRHLRTVIVADDGSVDGTAEVARESGAGVIVLPENRGKGNALRLLFEEARKRGFSAVVALDADGQHDPEDIPLFLEAHRGNPAAIITGSRMKDAGVIPSHRYNSMLVARFFISLAANQFIEDTQCGLRLYPLGVIESISILKERYVTETEILIKAGDSGMEIRCVPVKTLYPPQHRTHFRSVPDVAAISLYVISYIMVKWWIEGIRPGIINTYKGAGTGRDQFYSSPRMDKAFEVITLFASLPLSILYGIWYYVGRLFSISFFNSWTRCGIPVRRVLFSTILLPVLLIVSIVDLAGNRLRLRPNLTTGFVRKFYPNLWGG